MAKPAAEFESSFEAEYVEHPEMAAIAAQLLHRHEALQLFTDGLKIGYLSRLGEPSGQGEGLMAACQKASPLWRDLTGYDVVIWAWEMVWHGLDPRQREALTAHELCHIGRNKTGAVKLRKHDLEEFAWVARQYGRWDDAISHFAGALQLHDDEQSKQVTPIDRKKQPDR